MNFKSKPRSKTYPASWNICFLFGSFKTLSKSAGTCSYGFSPRLGSSFNFFCQRYLEVRNINNFCIAPITSPVRLVWTKRTAKASSSFTPRSCKQHDRSCTAQCLHDPQFRPQHVWRLIGTISILTLRHQEMAAPKTLRTLRLCTSWSILNSCFLLSNVRALRQKIVYRDLILRSSLI